jgi:hypothetical protein
MKKTFIALMIAASGVVLTSSCGENKKTDIVESGMYTGKAEEVDKSEKEIYVRTPDNKLLELYFTDKTTLTKAGAPANFDELKEGGQVEVNVEKKGTRLEPISVNILD